MVDSSPLRFAVQASDRLQQVAHVLCADNSCIQFCASLEATLANIIKWLQTLPDNVYSKREAVALLEELESLCQVCIAASEVHSPKYPDTLTGKRV